jgi:hypothetical protein
MPSGCLDTRLATAASSLQSENGLGRTMRRGCTGSWLLGSELGTGSRPRNRDTAGPKPPPPPPPRLRLRLQTLLSPPPTRLPPTPPRPSASARPPPGTARPAPPPGGQTRRCAHRRVPQSGRRRGVATSGSNCQIRRLTCGRWIDVQVGCVPPAVSKDVRAEPGRPLGRIGVLVIERCGCSSTVAIVLGCAATALPPAVPLRRGPEPSRCAAARGQAPCCGR